MKRLPHGVHPKLGVPPRTDATVVERHVVDRCAGPYLDEHREFCPRELFGNGKVNHRARSHLMHRQRGVQKLPCVGCLRRAVRNVSDQASIAMRSRGGVYGRVHRSLRPWAWLCQNNRRSGSRKDSDKNRDVRSHRGRHPFAPRERRQGAGSASVVGGDSPPAAPPGRGSSPESRSSASLR